MRDLCWPAPGAWRIGPRPRVERLEDPALGGTQILYLPELRGDWTGRRNVFEFIGGYQVQQQQPLAGQSANAIQSARNLYVTVTYWLRFGSAMGAALAAAGQALPRATLGTRSRPGTVSLSAWSAPWACTPR